jgi:hypothetical protein
MARAAARDQYHVEAEARRHQFRQQAERLAAKQRALELGHHVAASDLSQGAALRGERAIGIFARQLREARGIAVRHRMHLGRLGAQSFRRHARGHGKQDVARLDQLPGGEAARILLVVAPAFFLGRFGLRHFKFQHALDDPVIAFVDSQSKRRGPLEQPRANGFQVRPGVFVGAHYRVRTIW